MAIMEPIGTGKRTTAHAEPPRRLSIFDLDDTLTRRPAPAQRLLSAAMAPWQSLPGPQSDRPAIDRAVRQALARDGRSAGRKAIEDERAQGRLVIVVTAAPRFYAEAIGRAIGADMIVAIGNEHRAAPLRPAIAWPRRPGLDKLAAIRSRLIDAGHDLARLHVRAFATRLADLPILEYCDEPIVIDPSRSLARLADARGWPTLHWAEETKNSARRVWSGDTASVPLM